PVNIKNRTWKGKSNFLNYNIQHTKSSPMLGRGSIGNEKAFKPFWNEFTMEESKKWWLPTKTGCVGLDLNSWNGYSKSLTHGCWFTTKLIGQKQKIQKKRSKIQMEQLKQMNQQVQNQ